MKRSRNKKWRRRRAKRLTREAVKKLARVMNNIFNAPQGPWFRLTATEIKKRRYS